MQNKDHLVEERVLCRLSFPRITIVFIFAKLTVNFLKNRNLFMKDVAMSPGNGMAYNMLSSLGVLYDVAR